MLMVFDTDGSVQHTRNPKLDQLLSGQHKQVVRMTEILFFEEAQAYYIQFLTGDFAGRKVYRDEYPFIDFCSGIGHDLCASLAVCKLLPQLVVFDTYEQAVEFEVAFVDYLRTIGVRMA